MTTGKVLGLIALSLVVILLGGAGLALAWSGGAFLVTGEVSDVGHLYLCQQGGPCAASPWEFNGPAVEEFLMVRFGPDGFVYALAQLENGAQTVERYHGPGLKEGKWKDTFVGMFSGGLQES